MLSFEKLLIIGASRGLGRSLALFSGTHLEGLKQVILTGRKEHPLEETKKLMTVDDTANARRALLGAEVFCVKADLASEQGRDDVINKIKRENFDLVVYAAGGGPHGEFANKEWKDHLWALNLGLVSPMALVYYWLLNRPETKSGRFVIVGSRIAEQNPDPLAASYAASKHGLVGLVSSLQSELVENKNQVLLFSPGYMDSEMLPLTAKVRHDGRKLMSTDTAAQALWRWVKSGEGPWHRILN